MGKKRKLGSSGKDLFIHTVLEMLDEGTSLRDINLRKVARRIGCAHTNAYNYFESFEDLLWWSLRAALEHLVSMTGDEGENMGKHSLMELYIDFALAHPSWYRLIWMEPLGGTPPAEVKEYLKVPSRLFSRWLVEYFSGDPNDPDLAAGGRILHGYVHGELSAITTGRVEGTAKELKRQIMEHIERLFQRIF